MKTEQKRYHIKSVFRYKKILWKNKDNSFKELVNNIVNAKLLPPQKINLPEIIITYHFDKSNGKHWVLLLLGA